MAFAIKVKKYSMIFYVFQKTQGHTNCRLDWHQTGPWVVISIFAKKYDPNTSFVKLSPVKLSVELNFPFDNSVFSKNMELYGVFIIHFQFQN